MKKILMAMIICLVTGAAFAQQYAGPWDESIPKDCFCCNSIYNLPTQPPIYGLDTLNCSGLNTFSTTKCSTANYNWTITPAIPFSGQGTNTITLSAPTTTGAYTICVIISCGTKSVKNCRTVKATCCDCSQLPVKPIISGLQYFCLGKPCSQVFTYTVPNYGNKNCYTYEWTVKNGAGQGVAISGQGTNQINFNCQGLTVGTYSITVTIKCGNKVVANTIQLIVCANPSPAFTIGSDGGSATFTSTSTCTNFWFLVLDNNNNCVFDGSDSYTYQIGNSVTFNGLLDNKQYAIYHFVACQCGNVGGACWASKIMCFKWFPSVQMKVANGSIDEKGKISEKEVLQLDEIPAPFLKIISKDIRLEAKEIRTDTNN